MRLISDSAQSAGPLSACSSVLPPPMSHDSLHLSISDSARRSRSWLVQQTVQATFQEPRPPLSHRRFRQIQLCRAFGAPQNDAAPTPGPCRAANPLVSFSSSERLNGGIGRPRASALLKFAEGYNSAAHLRTNFRDMTLVNGSLLMKSTKYEGRNCAYRCPLDL